MLRSAIVGLGSMGKNHYRVLKKIKSVEIIALCDIQDLSSYPENSYRDIDIMLDEVCLDFIILAVPISLHAEFARKIIQKKIPILIEKPIASTVKEGERVLELAEAQEVPIAIGHTERFNPVVNALIEELQQKKIYDIHITRVGPFPPRVKEAGVLIDLGVHDIDLVRYITKQEIVNSYIDTSRIANKKYEDNAIISLSLSNNIVTSIVANWLTPFKKRTIEVSTNEAYYQANLITQELIKYSAYTKDNLYNSTNCPVSKQEPLFLQNQAFIHYIRTGDSGNLALGCDGAKALSVIENGLD
jgi:predicted dehydrogenase